MDTTDTMGRTTVELDETIRDELRSFKADHGLTYDEAILRLLSEGGWEFRHRRPRENTNGN